MCSPATPRSPTSADSELLRPRPVSDKHEGTRSAPNSQRHSTGECRHRSRCVPVSHRAGGEIGGRVPDRVLHRQRPTGRSTGRRREARTQHSDEHWSLGGEKLTVGMVDDAAIRLLGVGEWTTMHRKLGGVTLRASGGPQPIGFQGWVCRRYLLGERGQHARHVLEPVPAAHLDDQRRVGGRRCCARQQIPVCAYAAGRSVAADEADLAGRGAARGQATLVSTRSTSASLSSRFFAENGSIDGAITRTRSASSQVGT